VDRKLEKVSVPVSDADRAERRHTMPRWRGGAKVGRNDVRIGQPTPPGLPTSPASGPDPWPSPSSLLSAFNHPAVAPPLPPTPPIHRWTSSVGQPALTCGDES
jgi:hypothetical protein